MNESFLLGAASASALFLLYFILIELVRDIGQPGKHRKESQ